MRFKSRLVFTAILAQFVYTAMMFGQTSVPSPLKWKGRAYQAQPQSQSQQGSAGVIPHELIVKLKSSASKKSKELFLSQVSISGKRAPQAKEIQLGGVRFTPKKVIPISEKAISNPKQPIETSKGIERIFTIRLDSSDWNRAETILQQLQSNNEVEYVIQNRLYQLNEFIPNQTDQTWSAPNDSAYASQWNLRKINADKAWQVTKGDTSVKIGIIDTGIDYTHPDLIPNLFVNSAEDINHNGTFEPWDISEKRNKITFELDPNGVTGDFDGIDQDGNGYADDIIGWDFTDQPYNADSFNGFSDYENPDGDPFDDQSHGTACAGIAAAATNNAIGIAGVAPNCKLVALRVFTANGGYFGDLASDKDIASALIYAADNHIRVVNMSFGDVQISPLMRDAIQYAYSNGVVLCASAGNSGGDGQHFPSGYDEVICVVATTEYDQITSFTQYGNTADISAPGEGIPATYPFYRGYYTSTFGGTSASSPQVAAASALILSLHPEYTSEQVRGVLVASADDIESEGWDYFSGSGRLNIEKALQIIGTPIAKISSPVYDSGLIPPATIAILGTATSPKFQSYELQYRFSTSDDAQNSWKKIGSAQARPKINDTLATWNINTLADSSYTLRLVVTESSGRTIENRIRCFIDRTTPIISSYHISDALNNDRHAILIELKTNDLTEATLFYKPHGSSQSFSPIRFNGIKHTQYLLVTNAMINPDYDYDAFVQVKNLSGLISRTDTTLFRLNGEVIQSQTFGQSFLKEKRNLRLPLGTMLAKSYDFNQNGKQEVILNQSRPLEGITIGYLNRYEYNADSSKFIRLDTVASRWIPYDVTDFNNDGKLELLTQSGGKTIVFSQSSVNSSPFAQIAFADTTSLNFWSATFANTKGNSEKQILARNDTAYFTVDQSYNKQAYLPNPVKVGKETARPYFAEPKAVVEDFDGDGKPEILIGDYDANFFIYEYRGFGNLYDTTWLAKLPYIAGGNWIASGNFLGNGKKQFIIGAHSKSDQNAQDEYDAPIWIYQCWQASGNNRYEKIWEQKFNNYRDDRAFRSSIQTGDLDKDGIDELVILTYPNLYIFKWSNSKNSFVPIWNYPYATAFSVVIDDVDKNGLNELYFGDDLTTYAYEYQNFNGILSPVGVSIEPRGTGQIKLSWQKVSGATNYKIYRREYINTIPSYPFNPTFFAATSDSIFTDNNVNDNRLYVYAVTSTNGVLESDTSAYLFGVPHELPKLLSANFDLQQNLRLHFSERLSDLPLNSGWFKIEKNATRFIPTSTILASGGTDVVMSFRAQQLDTGVYQVRVSNVRDVYGSQLDTNATSASFTVNRNTMTSFYVVGRKILSSTLVELTFNKPLDISTASNVNNYKVSPDGHVSAAQVQSEKLRLTIAGRPLGSLGFTIGITLKNIRSTDGILIDTTSGGNTVAFSSFKQDLSNVFTYPNPYNSKAGVDYIMFANLTEKATIHIYTLNGKVIKKIEHSSDDGGARWMLDSYKGEKVASGIYFYRITADGVTEKIGKLAIVR